MSQKALENSLNNPIRKNKLIKLWKINKLEAQKKIACWFVDVLSDMQPKLFPSTPQRLSEANNLDNIQKRKVLASSEFWQQDDLKAYLDQRSQIKSSNMSNCYWLEETLDWLPEEDIVSRNKVISLLNDYRSRGLYRSSRTEKKTQPALIGDEVGWDD